jgi:hypothetical protein
MRSSDSIVVETPQSSNLDVKILPVEDVVTLRIEKHVDDSNLTKLPSSESFEEKLTAVEDSGYCAAVCEQNTDCRNDPQDHSS